MTNQDPLEPTSNTEFVSQLASFTALQTNEGSLYYNTVNYASSLAGRTVTVSTRDGVDENGKVKLKIETGVVTGVDISDDKNVEITVNGKRYPLGSVMNVSSNASGSTLSATDGAYAVSLIGKNVMLKAQNANNQTIIESGIVESIEVENGIYRIVMNGLSYPLDSVIKVGDFDKPSVTPPDTDDKTEDDTETEKPETKPSEETDDTNSSEDKAEGQSNDLMDMILYT